MCKCVSVITYIRTLNYSLVLVSKNVQIVVSDQILILSFMSTPTLTSCANILQLKRKASWRKIRKVGFIIFAICPGASRKAAAVFKVSVLLLPIQRQRCLNCACVIFECEFLLIFI